LDFSLVHPLLKDFGIGITRTRITLAEKGSEKARHEILDQVLQTVGAVEMGYWDLAYAIENLKLKRQSLDLAKKLSYETDIMVRAGEVSRINLIQAKTGVAARDEEVIIAESEVMKMEYDLMLLLDLPGHVMRIVPLSAPEKSATVPDVAESVEEAWKNHPQLMANKVELEQQDVRVKFAKNQMLPRLDFVAEYGFNGLSGDEVEGSDVGERFQDQTQPEDAFKDWFSSDAFDRWLLGLKFEAPLGNREARSRYIQAALDEKRIKTERRRLEEQIGTRVKKAILDIKAAIKRMDASAAAVGLAKEQLEAEVLRFKAGEASSSDVLAFERELTVMKTKELKAVIDYNTAWSKLRVAEGVSLQHYNMEFDPN
jgi:outer membrane protein TolC